MQETVSIVVADAQYLIRYGLKQLISQNQQFDVIAEVNNEQTLMTALEQKKPELVILDYDQPGHFTIHTLKAVKQEAPHIKIMIISANSDKHKIDQVLKMGVNCFLTKTCDDDEIFDGLKAAMRGEKFFCTQILDHLLYKSYAEEKPPTKPNTPLSAREIEIVKLIAQGLVAKEIADELHLSTHTVYTHRKNIMKKLHLNTSSELVMYALNKEIVSPKQ